MSCVVQVKFMSSDRLTHHNAEMCLVTVRIECREVASMQCVVIRLDGEEIEDMRLLNLFGISGCTPLIQSPIYCVKAHMQKHYFF